MIFPALTSHKTSDGSWPSRHAESLKISMLVSSSYMVNDFFSPLNDPFPRNEVYKTDVKQTLW